MIKYVILACAAVLLILFSAVSYPFILPDYRISEAEKNLTAEEALAIHKKELALLGKQVNIIKLRAHMRDKKVRLDQNERKFALVHERYCIAIDFWETTIKLKDSLIGLTDEKERSAVRQEADLIARSIISTIYRVSREWRVGASSLLRNFMIRIGARQKGYCYHYVTEMLKALPKRDWVYFDLHWATAWKGNFRENNSLVITAKDKDFESGIAIDPWRATGKPFWVAVKGDKYPWKEDYDE